MDNTQKPKYKSLYILPSLFTLANMGFGYYAITAALDGKWIIASAVITISVLMDGMDGRIARYTKTTSEFGMNFDSLVDAISFGVAPAIIIYAYWFNKPEYKEYRTIGWILSFIFVAAGALRLARFNVQSKSDLPNTNFMGLPIPGAAGFLCTLIWIYEKFLVTEPEYQRIFVKIFPITLIILSYLMISRIKYYSFKKAHYLFKKPIFVVIFLAVLIFYLVKYPSIVLFGIGFIYVFSGPVRTIFSLSKLSEKKNFNK